MPQRGVRDIKRDWKNEWEACNGKEVARLSQKEPHQSNDDTCQRKCVPEQQKSHERRIRVPEILPRGFRAKPCGNDPAPEELRVQSRVSHDEVSRLLPFVIQKFIFTKFGVQMNLLVPRDPIDFA